MLYLVVDARDRFYNSPYLVTDNYDEAVDKADEEQVTVIEINVGHYVTIYEWTEEEQEYEEEETQDYDPEDKDIDEGEEYESEDEASQTITYIAEVFEAS